MIIIKCPICNSKLLMSNFIGLKLKQIKPIIYNPTQSFNMVGAIFTITDVKKDYLELTSEGFSTIIFVDYKYLDDCFKI